MKGMEWKRAHWGVGDYRELVGFLRGQRDEKYAKFNKGLIPGEFEMIGVRMPVLRKLGKEIARGNWREYLGCEKDWRCHEEVMLEGLVISELKVDYEEAVGLMWDFSGKAFNWAITDCFVNDRFLRRYVERFWEEEVDRYLGAGDVWRVRIGLLVLQTYYLREDYIERVLEKVLRIKSGEYYVEMMMAWLIATAMVKCRDATVGFLEREGGRLSVNVRKFAGQKVRDSYRVSGEDKILVTKLLQN